MIIMLPNEHGLEERFAKPLELLAVEIIKNGRMKVTIELLDFPEKPSYICKKHQKVIQTLSLVVLNR